LRADKPTAAALGAILGIILGIAQVLAPTGVSNEIQVLAYGATIALVTAALLPSATLGLISGVTAMIFLTATEFVYYSVTYGSGIAAGLASYSALTLPRLLVPPLSGLLGGLIGAEYSTKSRRRRRKPTSKRVQETNTGKKRRKREEGKIAGTGE
jgi:hypothetical protein